MLLNNYGINSEFAVGCKATGEAIYPYRKCF